MTRRRPARRPAPRPDVRRAAPAVAEVQRLEPRALLSAVTVSAADNDAEGRQTVVLASDVTRVTVRADGAYDFLKIDADAVAGDLRITLAGGVAVGGQLWIEAEDAGGGAVELRGEGGGAVALAGGLRFEGRGAGAGDVLPDLVVGAADLSFAGAAAVGRVTAADNLFLEATGSARVRVAGLALTGRGQLSAAAEGQAALTVGDAAASAIGGSVRLAAAGRATLAAGDVGVVRDGAVVVRAESLAVLTAGDLSAGAGGTVSVRGEDGGRITAGDLSTRGTGGGVAVRANYAAVVTLGDTVTGGDFGVAGDLSGAVLAGDVRADGTVAVGLEDFAAAKLGAVDAANFALDAARGPVLLGAVAVSGTAAVRSGGDVSLTGTAGDDVLNMRRWAMEVAGTLTVDAAGGDDFVRLGEARLGALFVDGGDGDDVVRTDGLIVDGPAVVAFGSGAGTLAAWYGSAGDWAVSGSGDTRATFALGEVVGGVTFATDTGRDALVLTGATVGGRVRAETGAGRDTVVLRGGGTVGSVVAITGGDTDSIALVDGTVRTEFAVNAGGDADRISVARAVIAGTTRLTAGGGNDQVKVAGSSLRRVVVYGGGGKDRVRVQTSGVTDVMFADLGIDDDRLDLDARSTAATNVRLLGGDGYDRLVNGPADRARGFERIV